MSAAGRHGIELPDRYEIRPFAEADSVTTEDLIAFWEREGAVSGDAARSRVQEALLVATERQEGLVAVATAYLQRNEQLRLDMWYMRGFVAAAHRRSTVAWVLGLEGRARISERFVSGEDTRAPGIVYEVDSPMIRKNFPGAVWPRLQATYIGRNERGTDVRVHWFPGAEAPLPPDP